MKQRSLKLVRADADDLLLLQGHLRNELFRFKEARNEVMTAMLERMDENITSAVSLTGDTGVEEYLKMEAVQWLKKLGTDNPETLSDLSIKGLIASLNGEFKAVWLTAVQRVRVLLVQAAESHDEMNKRHPDNCNGAQPHYAVQASALRRFAEVFL